MPRRNPHDHGTVGIIIGADAVDPATLNTAHLSDIAGRLLRMIAQNRTGGAVLAVTPYPVLAGHLDCTPSQLRAALHEISDAGHGPSSYDTLAVTHWQPSESSIRRAV